MTADPARDEVSALLGEHGGLAGLAREIGGGDPNAWRHEAAANCERTTEARRGGEDQRDDSEAVRAFAWRGTRWLNACGL
jgi:hypothetical protein